MIHLVSRHDVESSVIHDSQTSEKSICFLIEYSTANITFMLRVRKSGAIPPALHMYGMYIDEFTYSLFKLKIT